ncbi:MAG: DUF3592 domain-containing protein [Rhodococcus sp.]|uniref:DUF3592 domain-containing protein n=1 Tax=Rhodococcus TaxID=1827 RepID=UPI001697D650|nr:MULTISPECIES: DUF3592 domain-containing protein [Rhodococcus]NLV78458.1 DUF3592 domain-containing protein [Rhodococcus sp. (in: high G+C Gram-positive bacteria)]
MSALHRARRVVLVVAIGISALSAVLLLAAWRNDHTITSDMGTATAEVLSAGSLRSAVSFVTPDGVTHNPELGVLYPTGLTAGQRIAVEYARSDPDLVRVTGRDARVAIVPTLSVIVVTWVVATPLVMYLGRRARSEVRNSSLHLDT